MKDIKEMRKRNIIIVFALLVFFPVLVFSGEEPVMEVEQSRYEVELEFNEKPPETDKKRMVEDILLLGNTVFEEEVLRQMMKTKKNQVYDEEKFIEDIRTVLKKYRDEGYIFTVITKSHEFVNEDESFIYIVVKADIEEEGRYLIDRIDVEGSMTYPENFIKSMLRSSKGDFFNKKIFTEDIKTLLTSYHSDGFPDTKVYPGVDVERATGTINLLLSIDEGKRGQIKVIEVIGNTITKTSVIIREMRIREGEYFTMKKLSEIKRRLTKMQVVRFVNMELYDTGVEGEVKLIIKVSENRNTSLNGIVGYNPPADDGTGGGLYGEVKANINNLLGTARKFKLNWNRLNLNKTGIDTEYTEPWIFGQPVAAAVNIKQTRGSENVKTPDKKYYYTRTGWGVSFLTAFTQYIYGDFAYGQTTLDVEKGEEALELPPGVIPRFSYDYTVGLELDTVDIPWSPTKGFKDKVTLKFETMESTRTKSDGGFYMDIIGRVNVNMEHYFNISENKVLAIRSVGGLIYTTGDTSIPKHDYYKIGGAKDLRGFLQDQFSGERKLLISNEFRLIFGEESYFSVFADIGACWNSIDEKGDPTTFDTLRGYLLDRKEISSSGDPGVGIGLGFGINMRVATGQISVSLAINHLDLDKLSEIMSRAKVHAVLETKF